MDSDDEVADPVDGDESGKGRSLNKQERIEKEKAELLASLAGGDFSSLKTRVAAILNLYPQARNSDIALTLKYWETFQPDVYDSRAIPPRDLFRLERQHLIVRARAKIQNEYGLFQADEGVRKHRKSREEEMQEAVLNDAAPRRVISIFADETGKNDEFVSVAAVWVLTGRAVFTVNRAIEAWQKQSPWATREIHFAKFGKRDLEPLGSYLGVIQDNREFLSFKVIAVEKSRTRRKNEEVVEKLHEHMLIRGADHEIHSGRIDLPREIELTIDQDQSLDPFTVSEMGRRIAADFERAYGGRLILSKVQTISSRNSALIQLADLIAGAINRRLNNKGERHYKDDMADRIIDTLGLTLEESNVPDLDASALFRV